MVSSVDLSAISSWFVVLPDCDLASPVRAALCGHATREIRHASGRTWLLGRWAEDAGTIGRAGNTRIALIGQNAVTTDELTGAAGRIRAIPDLDRLAASLVGSSHLVATVDGKVRVQGTATGVRPVFHAGVGGVTVAADRADVLADLVGARLDERRLAVHLLDPPVLYPLAGQPVWQGVSLVPAHDYLVLDGDRQPRSVRWWVPPEPVIPLAEGAVALREALSAAVAARVRDRPLVSCDLGGLDSTAVCSVAARGPAKLVAYTAASHDPAADDVYWAVRTVAGLGTVDHQVIPQSEMPLTYHGLLDPTGRLDEPCALSVDRERRLVILRRAAARGSTMHLTGLGGDELLYGSLAHLHTLLRTNPRIAVRQLRGFAVKYRWPRADMLRQLADRSSYHRWLDRVADNLVAPAPPLNEPLLDWGFQPRLPPWVTPATVAAVRGLIRTEARRAQPPLSGLRGQHRELEGMRFISRLTRQMGQMAARIGLELAAPYYDDRVIEAGLAVRPQDRITPWRYKPLILEAMRGIVPDDSLVRQTKANATCEEDTGMRRNRADLLALWEDSRLGRLGLVDAGALRQVCARPLGTDLQIGVLHQAVACEMWLRSLERSPVPTGVPS